MTINQFKRKLKPADVLKRLADVIRDCEQFNASENDFGSRMYFNVDAVNIHAKAMVGIIRRTGTSNFTMTFNGVLVTATRIPGTP